MNAFRFRAARLLDWRRRQADRARAEFLRASESAREAAAVRSDAEASTSRASHEYRGAMAGVVDSGTLQRYRIWIARQQAHLAACAHAFEEKRHAAAEAADLLQHAKKNVKVLEHLRDRTWERYQNEERRREMNDMNELATQKYARLRMRGLDRGR